MERQILRYPKLAALLPALAIAACNSPSGTPCQASSDCPADQGCSPEGYCAPLLGRAGNGANGGDSTGASTAGQTVNANSGSSSGGNNPSAGNGGSSSSSGSIQGGSSGGSTSSSGSNQGSSSGGIHLSGGSIGGFTGGNGNGSSSSGSSGSGNGSSSGGSSSGGTGTPTGVGPQGGTLSSLVFAVVGDTRPQNEGDTANYPTQDITWIYQNIQAASPRPAFVVGTGDYAYCSGSDCAAQTANYITAAKNYSNQVFLAMGNHECNGYTASNCAADNYLDGISGITPNYSNFFNLMNTFGINSTSQPTLASGNPYYEVDVSSSDATDPWTAKFVFIAANAWDSGQSSWLTSVMAKPTTYTFVVRHESYQDDGGASSNQPGDQGASDQIIDSASDGYTMLLVGHTHEYLQTTSGSSRVELIVGNGGAQSSGSPGYVICSRVTGGNISCQPYNAGTTASVNGSAVVVNAAGQQQ
ncbi:MAG: metallophosphoesterase [Myxococcales bacterium]